jgi:hypothetical protein
VEDSSNGKADFGVSSALVWRRGIRADACFGFQGNTINNLNLNHHPKIIFLEQELFSANVWCTF